MSPGLPIEPFTAIGLVGVREFGPLLAHIPPPGDGDVVIDVDAIAICGSDLLGYLGRHPRIRPPSILGHELAGTVQWVGPDQTDIQVGDRVAVDPTFGCGACRFCARGAWNICERYVVLGETDELPGGMAGVVVVPADHAHRLPQDVDAVSGAIAQSIAVGHHAAIHRGQVQSGETAVIIGGGAIGLGILMAAVSEGARAIVVDTLGYRLRLAEELGAEAVVDAAHEDVVERVRTLSEGYGADVTFEAVGGGLDHLFNQGLACTSRGGRLVVVGLKTAQASFDLGSVKWGEKTVIGSQAHPNSFPEVIARIGDGTYRAGRLVSHEMPLENVAEAFGLLESRADSVLKIVLTPTLRSKAL